MIAAFFQKLIIGILKDVLGGLIADMQEYFAIRKIESELKQRIYKKIEDAFNEKDPAKSASQIDDLLRY